MLPKFKKWIIETPITVEAEKSLADFHPVLRQLLFIRGYAKLDDAQRYLAAVPPDNTDPMNLTGMDTAVGTIYDALRSSKQIIVYGDYDVDGVTGTALLVECLRKLGANSKGYIPNRFEEGYGLNKDALDILKHEGADLVITVDCGIRSLAEAEHAHRIGLDLIITDHHHPHADLPDATAIINPKQPNDKYPDKDLAGVGIAYKLATGLLGTKSNQLIDQSPSDSDLQSYQKSFLDLVTLGTIADLAPLIGENRALVREGLGLLTYPRRQGIKSLIGISGISDRPIQSYDVGYMLGPRLNAAGRLESALAALELLQTNDITKAGELAQKLNNQNTERQKLTKELTLLAEELYAQQVSDNCIILVAHPDFNPGVIGLVASRLVEKYYKPSIVAHIGEEFTRGSCRSIHKFHITEALDSCKDLLEHHGGHAAAAGFTVRNDKLNELFERLKDISNIKLSSEDLQPTLQADMEFPLYELKPEFLGFLEKLQPTGYGNREAIFISRNLKVMRYKTVGVENSHLKLSVKDKDRNIVYNAIAFRQGNWAEHIPEYIDLIYTFEKNIYNQQVSLQLNVKDIRPANLDQ